MESGVPPSQNGGKELSSLSISLSVSPRLGSRYRLDARSWINSRDQLENTAIVGGIYVSLNCALQPKMRHLDREFL
jgi:hypothetical protein